MKYLLVFLFIFQLLSIGALAQELTADEKHPLEDLSVLSNAMPTEFILMINHLKALPIDDENLKRIIVASELINQELGKAPEPNIMFLTKSEIYRGILNNQYLKQGNQLQISSTIVESAKEKLNKHKIVYTPFSTWLINSILSDFQPYFVNDFINQYQNVKRTDYNGQLKLKRLEKVSKYLSPWLNAINHLSPEEFNKLCSDTIIDTLERISKKTYYFSTFTGKAEPITATPILTIPTIKLETSTETKETTPVTLSDEANQRKEEAKEDIKEIESEDLSGLSSEIDAIDSAQ